LPALALAILSFLAAIAGAGPAAAAAAGPDEVIRLGPGTHPSSLGRVRGPLRIEGAGAGVTVVAAPEGEDGLVVEAGTVAIAGLTLTAAGPRAGLKVLGGEVTLDGVAVSGGAAGVFVDGTGRLAGRDIDLSGGYGLLLRSGEASLSGARVRGSLAGVAVLGGRLRLERSSIDGPATEAGVSISGGTAAIEEVVIRSPGPSGLSVLGSARVEVHGLDVSGALEENGILGDCVQLRRASLEVEAAVLTRCGGAAVEASGGTLALHGVDATGGDAGCLVLLDGARAQLEGNRCTGRGPAVVSASGAQAWATMNRWLADPVLWVECGSGARVHLGVGEAVREPCRKQPETLDKPVRP